MNEYVDFMKKYTKADNPVGMLADYTKILQKYTSFAQAVENYDSKEMSAADAAYYLEVTNRVSKKLLEVAKESDSTSEDTGNKGADENKELVDGMRPEFKEAMDSYEAFYDEYCNMIKKYNENPSDMKLLADYTAMLTKAAEMTEKFNAWENSDMNSAESKYYLDVNNRVTQKLLEVAE